MANGSSCEQNYLIVSATAIRSKYPSCLSPCIVGVCWTLWRLWRKSRADRSKRLTALLCYIKSLEILLQVHIHLIGPCLPSKGLCEVKISRPVVFRTPTVLCGFRID